MRSSFASLRPRPSPHAWLLALLLAPLCALFGTIGAPTRASAQRTVAYDTVSEGTPAAVTCGFCAMEKFGTVFYDLGTPGGLAPSEFPLMLTAVQVAVARIRIVGDILGGYECEGLATTGTVDFNLAVFAGETVPTTITMLSSDDPWPGETLVYSSAAVPLEMSVATMDGGNMFNVMINELPLPDGGVMVDAPNTYLRVVLTIPAGAGPSMSCSDLGLTAPAGVSIRDDDGRIAPRRSLIWAVGADFGIPGLGIDPGWYWNEDVPDMMGGATGVNGDWALRIKIAPMSGPGTDGGMSTRDGGMSMPIDGGPIAASDGGATGGACTASAECSGGEVCEAGRCVRTACTTTAECGGGRTCVEGRCRNLCDTDRDCEGGEVCDTAAGVCTDAESGGCGCRVASRSGSRAPWSLIGLGALTLVLRRRRRRRTPRAHTHGR